MSKSDEMVRAAVEALMQPEGEMKHCIALQILMSIQDRDPRTLAAIIDNAFTE